jgi:UDP-N-acetylglucosamine 4,6-dehydratase/5-epimerase
MAKAIGPKCELKIVGIRPGEKLHEVMVPEDDAYHTLEYEGHYAIMPVFHDWDARTFGEANCGKPCPAGFCYSSENNTKWLTVKELKKMIGLAGEDPNG